MCPRRAANVICHGARDSQVVEVFFCNFSKAHRPKRVRCARLFKKPEGRAGAAPAGEELFFANLPNAYFYATAAALGL